MQIETWPIGKPIDYKNNARKWSPKAIAKVGMSLKTYGWRQPIVVDTAGVIVIGHLRRASGKSIGFTECPVHVARDLTPTQIRGLRLADNRTHDESLWDGGLLGLEFAELAALDFDMSLTGFDAFELGANWNVGDPANGTEAEWAGMPEFTAEDKLAWQTVKIHFRNAEDREQFARLIGQSLTDKTKYVWHPEDKRIDRSTVCYSAAQMKPRYPVYVISKGRWESRLTCKALAVLGVEYRLVIEPQEYEQYAAVIDPARILRLPFSELGEGSIPARNWVWEHSISEGADRHWILDDNIRIFYRLHDNMKVPLDSGATFCAAEDFVDRYENIGLAGMQYQWLAKQKQKLNPYVLNTRIYSCILVDNRLPFRWRGRYNEDTDLSLRVLKSERCTVLFQAFLADKITTMAMSGGNTDELYQGEGRLLMAKSLQEQHPDVVKVVQKWGRWQHQVDYRPFKGNKFIPKPGFTAPTEANNYGMELQFLQEAPA